MAFYSCPKCKNVWQYPIEKCPECFEKLEKLESKKIKVIGVSKVTIPTFLNPKVPYFVLVLEDEHGNRWVQKSEKEYKIGDEIFFEKIKDERAVAICRVNYDVLDAIEKVVEFLGGIEIDENSKILILPTLEKPVHPYFRENTSPEFLEAVLIFLLKKGAKKENVKVMGQSFNQFDILASATKSQLLPLCQRFQVLPYNIAEGKFLKKGEFEIFEEVFSANLILNLPILKFGKYQACENLLKLLKKENYFYLEYLRSKEEILEDLIKTLPKILTLAEADTVLTENNLCAILNLVLASYNCKNLDRVFYEIIMKKDLPEFLKKVKIEDIPILGRKISEVQVNL